MKFVDWYLKISIVSAMIGGSMEYFMIKTGFCVDHLRCKTLFDFLWINADDKVTVLEAEKRSWESTPEAQAIRDSLNPWREHDNKPRKAPSTSFQRKPAVRCTR